MTAGFYRAFEDQHRGSRELIKSRLRVYLPFVESIKALYADAKAIDLGCGRGEWLALLQEAGVAAQGVDVDDGMLSACREAGLTVATGEAVAYLKMLPDESQAIVSGFHIAEHIPFAELQILVQEALRVLKPAGLLILETPNPENIAVGTANFYLDPTHQSPLPPPLLAFLPAYYGFNRTKILRLQEPSELVSSKQPSLADVFNGASPDYAIVAQKNTSQEILSGFSACFDNDYGLTLETLSGWYDERLQAKIDRAKEIAEHAQAKAELAETCAKQTNSKTEQLLALMQQADTKAEQMLALMQQADVRVQQAFDKLNAIYDSRSWRVTAPMRWVGFQLRLLRQHGPVARLKALVKKCVVPIVRYGIAYVYNRPTLRRYCLLMARNSGLYSCLRYFYLMVYTDYSHNNKASGAVEVANWQLTPKTQRIYIELLTVVKQQEVHASAYSD